MASLESDDGKEFVGEKGEIDNLLDATAEVSTNQPSVASTPAIPIIEEESRCSRMATRFRSFARSTSASIYVSHFLSCWGDRMWNFAVGLYLNDLQPESMRLVAAYGLAMGAAGVLMGAVIGDIVDKYPRLPVARTVLLFQNLFTAVCAVLVCLVYQYKTYLYSEFWMSSLCEAAIISLAIISYLFSVALKISVQKDWVSVICEGNTQKLARLSSSLRGIDQFALVAAPILTGFLMSYGSMLISSLFIAGWNLCSVSIEYLLLLRVYRMVPDLAIKERKGTQKDRKKDVELNVIKSNATKTEEEKCVDEEKIELKMVDENSEGATKLSSDPDPDEPEKVPLASGDSSKPSKQEDPKKKSLFRKIFSFAFSLKNGWSVYMSYEVKYAGLGLACLFMTVIAFDNITSGYAYSQGASQAVIGGLKALGAICGLIATFTYPLMTKKIGVERSGLYGLFAQILALTLCVASVWLPGSPFDLSQWTFSASFSAVRTSSFLSSPENGLNATYGNESSHADHPAVSHSFISLGFLMAGIITSRFGLYTADLAICQLLLEKVDKTERGAVNGVQSSLNTAFDMLRFILVILMPAPNTFGLLIILSFGFICLGFICYAFYVRKARGHLIHIEKIKCTSNNNT